MKATIFLSNAVILTLLITESCAGQFIRRVSPTVAFAAMNTTAPTTSFAGIGTSHNISGIGNTPVWAGGNTTTFNGAGDITKIASYTSSVSINYQIPGIVFFDWAAFRRDALAALNDGPGNPSNPNYLPSDVPALNALAYNGYLNPGAYGQNNLMIDVRQWNGRLNWYSSTAGGGQYIKNWVILFLPVDGHFNLLVK